VEDAPIKGPRFERHPGASHPPVSHPPVSHPLVSHPLVSHLDWDRAVPASLRDARTVTAPRGGRRRGDTMRKAFFNLYLSWLLVFGGSGTLLRRVA
jgi:hypothetical protein